jgi:hypothetical protein
MSAPSCATLRASLFTQLFFSVIPGVGECRVLHRT